MKKSFVALVLILFILFIGLFFSSLRPAEAATRRYQILPNLIHFGPPQFDGASKIAADGVWGAFYGAGNPNLLRTTLSTLNASKWAVVEGFPSRGPDWATSEPARNLQRMPDAFMFYTEGAGQLSVISNGQINQYADFTIPGFGKIGKRIVVLARSYQDKRPKGANFKQILDTALANPNVSGVAFELLAANMGAEDSVLGCKKALSLNKKCYFDAYPGSNNPNQDFLGDFQRNFQALDGTGLLGNPNFYIVPAEYSTNSGVHFLSTGPNDRRSIEGVVKWLIKYRGTNIAPLLGDVNTDGYVDGKDIEVIKANFDSKYSIFDYNQVITNFGK